jgi:predicted ATP-grasp superfamily ATP-dependent carboligase
MKTVIILDGHLRSALTAVRSLGAAGYHVVCGSHRRTGLALFSRHTDRAFHYPPPLESLDAFQQEIARIARQCSEPPLIYAFSDATFLGLSRARDLFAGIATLVMPAHESVETAFDKRRTVALAQELELAVPVTHDDLSTATMPAVIKPQHSVSWRGDRGVKSEVHIAQSMHEAVDAWEQLHGQTGEMPFAQEYVSAAEYGVAVLCQTGEIKAHCVHRRVRSLSPSGGASAVRVTVDPPAGMMEACEKLCYALSWEGIAMIEFRVGTADQVPYLVEINGRFWGSLALAQYAGIDFPLLYAHMAQGREVPVTEYRRSVYARYLLGDIAHLLRAPGSLGQFLSYGGRDHFYDVESWRDPLPALIDIIDKMY